MKYVLGIILAFVLILPSKSLAGGWTTEEKDSSLIKYYPRFWGLAIGGGPQFFTAGIDFYLNGLTRIYPRNDNIHDEHELIWNNQNALFWTNRIRMIYDYKEQIGVLFQPNLRWYFKQWSLSATVGPEIGWISDTGFEYGASLRIGGLPGLVLFNHEVGYLVNSKKLYYTISFCFSVWPPLLLGDYRG